MITRYIEADLNLWEQHKDNAITRKAAAAILFPYSPYQTASDRVDRLIERGKLTAYKKPHIEKPPRYPSYAARGRGKRVKTPNGERYSIQIYLLRDEVEALAKAGVHGIDSPTSGD